MPQVISVIVPVYNLEAYIQHTLDSLFAQTHKELEVIAVDDGSTDGSPTILDDYAMHEPRLKVIHQANGGVSAARNAGLAAATGDYIGFCDGDDEVEPTMYERLLANLHKYDADISHCGFCIEGLDGIKRFLYNTGKLCIHNHVEGLLELLKGEKFEPSLCNKLFKKELFIGFQFDSSIKLNEDLLANVQLFQKVEKSVFEDVCLYRYIRRAGSASKKEVSKALVFNPIEVRSKILEICKGEDESIQKQVKANYMHLAISAYSLICSDRTRRFHQFKDLFRQKLSDHRKWLNYLPLSSRVHASLIIYLPFAYTFILSLFRLYSKDKKYG